MASKVKAHTVSEAGIANIRKTIDAATANPKTQIPGFVACAVNKDGEVIFSHASGKRGVDTDEPMTLDSIFWIASCTKMIGGIACMQLVEQGRLALDDAKMVEDLCPELRDVKILKEIGKDGTPVLVEKKNRITLRMLLSHTAGFGYTFFRDDLRRAGLPAGFDEFSGMPEDINMPLLFEPGTNWTYGVNIDWAGVVVERVTNMSLNDYFQTYIFTPLGMKNITMFPTPAMKSRLAHMHARHLQSGEISVRDHPMHRPLTVAPDSAAMKDTLNSAGAGCFAQPTEYVKLIAMLLNDGTSPTTGAQLLKPETVASMFENQIPQFPDFGRVPIDNPKPDYTNKIPELYSQPGEAQGWGLTFMLTIKEGGTGRGRNTGWWAGLPNLFWWCDRESGVGGMVASQILPFADPQVMGLWVQVEKGVYDG